MSLLTRSIVAGTAGIALMGLAACGGHGNGLANLDPCKVVTPQQLTTDGLQTQGTPAKSSSSFPGCTFRNHATELVTFFKNQSQTVAAYEQQEPTQSYTKITLNGRSAVRAEPTDAGNAAGECDVLIDAGGGMVLVNVIDPGPTDRACTEAVKYSQQIEPGLPK